MDLVRELDLMFFVALCTVTSFIAVTTHYLMQKQKLGDALVQLNTKTWVLFWFCHVVSYTLGLISRLYLSEYENAAQLVDTISMNAIMIGVTIKVYYVEKLIEPIKRHYFTFFNLFAIVFIFVTWETVKSSEPIILIVFLLQALGFVVLPFMYLYIAMKSEGLIRKNAIFALVGLLIIELSLSFQAHNVVVVIPNYIEDFIAIFRFPPQILNPILVIVGTLLVYKSYSHNF